MWFSLTAFVFLAITLQCLVCLVALLLNVPVSLSLVERVRSQWDSTQHGVEARLQQLDNMIGHSNQWEEQRKEVTALIGHMEGRLHNLLQQARDPLTKQLADSKVREKFDCFTFPPCPLGVSRLSFLGSLTVILDL